MHLLLSHRGKPYLLDGANKIAGFNIEMSDSAPATASEVSSFENPATGSASEAMKGGRRRRRTHHGRSHRNRKNRRNTRRNRKNRRNTRRNRNRRN